MTTPRTSRPPLRAQRGFTLVELMVGVALGLLVMVALIAVYLNVSRTNSEMAKTNGMIENGRFAIDVLNEDLMHGGYWAGYVPVFDNYSVREAVPTDVPTQDALDQGPCLAYAQWSVVGSPPMGYRNMLVGVPVEVYGDGVPTGCSTSTVVKDRKAGTDVLVVRHADTCVPGATNCDSAPSPSSTKLYFQSSQCDTEISASNFFKLSIVQTDFTLKARNCTTVQPLRKFVSNIYYIRTWASTEGDGIPTLVRSSFDIPAALQPPEFRPAEALIEGIEEFRVELGVDSATRCAGAVDYTKAIKLDTVAAGGTLLVPGTCSYDGATASNNTLPTARGDGIPDGAYVRCAATGCTVAQLTNVVAVKLYLIARSRDKTEGYTDAKTYNLGSAAAVTYTGENAKYKRHQFQTVVRLVNISGRRETP